MNEPWSITDVAARQRDWEARSRSTAGQPPAAGPLNTADIARWHYEATGLLHDLVTALRGHLGALADGLTRTAGEFDCCDAVGVAELLVAFCGPEPAEEFLVAHVAGDMLLGRQHPDLPAGF